MIDFFLVCIYLLIAAGTGSSDIGCHTHATILREIKREGFHIDVHYLIELVVDVETASKWENCSLVLKENIGSSFYVSPDQLSELNRIENLQACTPQKVDIEASQHLSKRHTLYVYSQLRRSLNLMYSSLNFPLHMRYHMPKVNGGYSLAELKSPILLIRCPNFDCENLLKSKAPCFYCGNDICTWNRFPYKTNNKNITLPVPVGNLSHLWFITLVTYILTFGGCLYILLAIMEKIK